MNKKLIKPLLVCVGFILVLLGFIFFALPFLKETLLGTTSSGYDVAFGDNPEALILIAWILSLLLLLASLCVCALSVMELLGKKPPVKLEKMMKLILAGALVLVGFLVFLFALLTKAVTYGNNEYIVLGLGAVLTAIFTLLGSAAIGFGLIAEDVLK